MNTKRAQNFRMIKNDSTNYSTRHIPEAKDVLKMIEENARGRTVSPLLQEWMDKNGFNLTSNVATTPLVKKRL